MYIAADREDKELYTMLQTSKTHHGVLFCREAIHNTMYNAADNTTRTVYSIADRQDTNLFTMLQTGKTRKCLQCCRQASHGFVYSAADRQDTERCTVLQTGKKHHGV